MVSYSFFILNLRIKRYGDVPRKRALHELLRTLQRPLFLEIKLDHNHDGLSEQQEARQIFTGRCKRRATENLSGRPSKIIKQELASTLNSSVALNYQDLHCLRQRFYRQRRKALPALPKNISQVSDDKHDKFQLDALYLYISRCMMWNVKTADGENFVLFNNKDDEL